MRRALAPRDPALASTVFGVRFPGPLGLAAGFDKDGLGLGTWGALGFGYAEVGTVTALPSRIPSRGCSGLPRTGHCSTGWVSTATARANSSLRLSRRRPDVPVGVNIGKSKATPPERAAEEVAASARSAAGVYLVVNVSSPNTPGLRDLQATESLRPILTAVLAETTAPVLVKIAPDLADEDVDAVADLAVELGLAGIVATNTTISRAGVADARCGRPRRGRDLRAAGGTAGPRGPAYDSTSTGDRLVLIGVGGIETAEDAWQRIISGASLLQGYTGFVYGGGLWAKHIHDGIAAHLHAGGYQHHRGGRLGAPVRCDEVIRRVRGATRRRGR